MSDVTKCPQCGAVVVYVAGCGKLKIRTSMLAITAGGAEVVCRRCGADVPIDIHLGPEMRKALEGLPRLVLKTN